jgi:hypothetical protein
MRYRLRTLMILLALLPPLLWIGWTKYEVWRAERDREQASQEEMRRAEAGRMAKQKAIEKLLAAQAALVEARMQAQRDAAERIKKASP